MILSADIATYISALSAVVSAGYAALGHHFPHREDHKDTHANIKQGRRSFLLTWLPPVVAVAAVGFGYYDRRYGTLPCSQPFILSFGTTPPRNYYAIVNGTAVMEYATNFKLMLIVRDKFANIDEMTDTDIEKTSLYTIEPQLMTLANASDHVLNRVLNANVLVIFYVALIPINYSKEDIKSLADIGRVGGKLLAYGSTNIVGSTSAH